MIPLVTSITTSAESAVPGIAGLLAVFVLIAVGAAVARTVMNAFNGGSDDE